MFRCCLPCRGGPQQAPATSPPSSPESENFTSLYIGDSVQDDRPGSVTSASIRYETQTSPLPHIEEEEELDASHHTSPDDCTSLSEQLIASQKSIRIVESQHHQQQSVSSLSLAAGATTASASTTILAATNSRNNQTANRHIGASGDDATTPIVSNSPSPRSKQRVNSKTSGITARMRGVTCPQADSKNGITKSITSTTSSSDTTTATSGGTVGNQISASAGSASGLLLPKMQAEQGSIGDLQKYHSRYLKNRRHTLANVR